MALPAGGPAPRAAGGDGRRRLDVLRLRRGA